MTIGSCTSCESSRYSQIARECQSANGNNDIATEQALRQKQRQMQEYFTPDPSHIIDIKA